MSIHIHIDFTPRQKKIVRAAVVTGAVIAALGIGIAVAAPHQWKSNDTLAAADLNGLNVATYASPDGGTSQYSVGATTYCGTSATAFNGNIGGREAAKKQCETTCGSPTAHMCTSEEMARSRALGMTLNYGSNTTLWYSSGGTSYYNGGATAYAVSDCNGWTVSTGANTVMAEGWVKAFDGTGIYWCSSQFPIACCD